MLCGIVLCVVSGVVCICGVVLCAGGCVMCWCGVARCGIVQCYVMC